MSKVDLSLIKQAQEAVGDQLPDLNNADAGGGFELPAIGPTRTRLVGYVETGVHTKKSGKFIKTKPRADLTFELSGPKHEPKVLESGDKLPFKVVLRDIVIGRHIKNGYMKLFKQLNYKGTARNFVDLMFTEGWRAKVGHWKTPDGARTIVQLTENQVYTFAPPEFQDPETGDTRTVSIPPALSTPRLFLWDSPTIEQWDSLYIEGERDDGTSKNFIQEKIRQAENFEGSPIQQLLLELGRDEEAVPLARRERPAEDDAPAEEAEEEAPEAASLTEGVAEKQQKAAAKPAAKAVSKAPVRQAPAKAPGKAQAASKPAGKARVANDDADPLSGL